jgi:hypothetical protein
MPDPAAPHIPPGRNKDPNFLAVVAAAVVAALLFFVVALLVVRHYGQSLLPKKQHDYEPHSYLQRDAPFPPRNPSALA